jgi:cytoskeletal protein CcmA (bactofilin family)
LRCPKCFREQPLKDVTLTGDVTEERVMTAGKIIVAAGARVCAELVACKVDIAGKVLGNVVASQTCHIRATGKLAGQVLCRYLQLDEGAEMEGSVEIVTGEGADRASGSP